MVVGRPVPRDTAAQAQRRADLAAARRMQASVNASLEMALTLAEKGPEEGAKVILDKVANDVLDQTGLSPTVKKGVLDLFQNFTLTE